MWDVSEQDRTSCIPGKFILHYYNLLKVKPMLKEIVKKVDQLLQVALYNLRGGDP